MDTDQLATHAILLALEDAGMKKDEVDGYLYQQGIGGGPHGVLPMAMAGIPVKFSWEMPSGGCNCISMIITATAALEAGLCKACIILHATSASSQRVLVGAGGAERSTDAAYGAYGPGSHGAWIARRFMHLYGLTRRQLGSVALTFREYANHRPEAVMHAKKLTMDDYLNARMIVEPLCLYDFCLVNDGAFPCNTSGTELSWSYLQGFSHLTEGVRQLRNEAGKCQVKDAEICMVTGLGPTTPGSLATCCILRR